MRTTLGSSIGVLVVGLVLILVAYGSSVVCLAQNERLIGGVGITLFDGADFKGKAVTFREDVPNLFDRDFNDRARSIRVGPGEQWEVCEAANFGGRCIVVSGEERDLRQNGWNNIISSVRRVNVSQPPPSGGNGYIVLFTARNYTGSPTNYKSAQAIIQKNVRSVTIGSGTWEICDGMRFQGRCVTLTQSVPDLGSYNVGQTIRSVRPTGIVPPSPTPNAYIVLFDQTNYRGGPTNYNRSEANIGKQTRSITIGAGTWEICDGRNFTGRCQTLSQSVPDLRTLNIGQTIRSVRPLGPQPR